MRFGIDIGSILVPFLHKCHVLGWLIFNDFGIVFLSIFDRKSNQKADSGTSLYRRFFDPAAQGMFLKIPWLSLVPS